MIKTTRRTPRRPNTKTETADAAIAPSSNQTTDQTTYRPPTGHVASRTDALPLVDTYIGGRQIAALHDLGHRELVVELDHDVLVSFQLFG